MSATVETDQLLLDLLGHLAAATLVVMQLDKRGALPANPFGARLDWNQVRWLSDAVRQECDRRGASRENR